MPRKRFHGHPFNDKRRYYREEYLKSDHWKDLKARKLRKVAECQSCGTSSNLDVHHIRYRNLYDVQMFDLEVLCRRCHKQRHKDMKKPGYWKKYWTDLRNKSRQQTYDYLNRKKQAEIAETLNNGPSIADVPKELCPF